MTTGRIATHIVEDAGDSEVAKEHERSVDEHIALPVFEAEVDWREQICIGQSPGGALIEDVV